MSANRSRNERCRQPALRFQRAYAIGLAHFFNWLHHSGGDPDRVTRQIVGRYIAEFARGGRQGAIASVGELKARQPRTINHRISVLSSYFDYCIRCDTEDGRGPWNGRVNPASGNPLADAPRHDMIGRELPRHRPHRPDSPFAPFAPRTIPVNRHTLLGHGFEKARARTRARITATILELEREMPKIRAFALQRWKPALAAPKISTSRGYPWSDEVDTFWDWALLELLVQSGLRIDEASELTTLDILRRSLADERIYYLLHIKPSKFDRARVIPIGDSLGRVLAEIIRYVKRFYNSDSVPVCDHWDLLEKRPRPPAPYLLQGIRHPSTAGIQTIRSRIRELSIHAEAKRSDGSPLVLLPHDCRRVFASEHLNNNTPVHIIQVLLGHASPDTVMIYAKLYPSRLVEEYRKTVRGLYNTHYGEDALKNPTTEEWAAFAATFNLRDMGTHLCALPTGEHCPRGLICLGCTDAQPKKSAVPILRRMLASHQRSPGAAREHNGPAGQIASRELEIVRIKGALQRAEELSDDVAAAIEGVL